MQADNPRLILQTNDARLDHDVELTLIGKSALAPMPSIHRLRHRFS
jgi:hypothetical protein